MTDSTLSPAAQVIVSAFNERHELCGPFDANWDELCLAAALRAAADKANPEAYIEDINHVHQNYVDGWKDALDIILNIADELEAQP